MRTSFPSSLLIGLGLVATFACSTGGGSGVVPSTNPPIKNSSSGGSSGIFGTNTGVGSTLGTKLNIPDYSTEPAPPGCGDGILTDDESCDDGNKESGDGCLANCKGVEHGYSCVPAGQACRQIARCGDSVQAFPELCDDGNTEAGDGCSPTCKYEIGYKCEGTVCSRTTCGDGVQEGAESCEDGNTMPFDGCSSDCQNEPQCGEGACTSACGDGIVLGEECDDGNQTDGDGCSSECKVEEGYTCRSPELGDMMQVPMVVRDFDAGADFEKGGAFAMNLNFANQGLLKDKLEGPERKPVLRSTTGTFNGSPGKDSGIASADSFAQWFDDGASGPNKHNGTIASKLNLYLNEAGTAYVNRYGNKGDGLTDAQYKQMGQPLSCGEVGKEDHDAEGNVIPCTSCYYDPDPSTPECDQHQATLCEDNPDVVECVKSADGRQWTGTIVAASYDGNPTFFPADAIEPFSPSSTTQISGHYDPTWPEQKGLHNFSFTTEVRYWFEYDDATTYNLNFVGDDDVWVFINGRLAVDLGGVHVAVKGDLTFGGGKKSTVEVTTTSADEKGAVPIVTNPDLGLESGNVYEIVVLQAERQIKASNYQLTLSGFKAAASDCSAFCGDGVPGIGEECDDGVNDGGYGECGPDCKLGEYCGDGVKQGDEDCDDGVNVGNPCPSGCRELGPLF